MVGGLGAAVVVCAALLLSAWVSEAYPSSLLAGAPRIGKYFAKLIPDLRPPVLFAGTETQGSFTYWMYRLDIWLWLLFETSQMAALATFSGAAVALLLCFPAARNLAPNRAMYFVFRRLLELFRSVPDIVYALILVWTFGVGPLAGILAIALHTVGALGKLFAEVVENAEMGPWDAMRGVGCKLGEERALRHPAASVAEFSVLRAAAVRDQCSWRDGDWLCRRWRDRTGALFGDQLQLLPGDRRDHRADHPDGECDRPDVGAVATYGDARPNIVDGHASRHRRYARALPACLRRHASDARAAVDRWAAVRRMAGRVVVWFDITPARLSRGMSGLFVILRQMIPPSPGTQWQDILQGLAQSVAMAFLGTFVAAVIALPLGFLGARNVLVNALAHFSIRRVFDGFRGVDQLIWALAFVRAVGLGPLAGVMAIAAADICVLAKLFAEAIENADPRQTDAVTAAGGTRLLEIRYGLLPQVLPVLLAQVLYSFESNTRSAAILGVVGAGGIGLQIAERIKVRYWDEVSFIIILILLTVAVIDQLSARVRRRLIG